MTELQFVSRREAEWAAWERWLRATAAPRLRNPLKRKNRKADAETDSRIPDNAPHAFRRLCHDLALSRDRQYSSLVQDRLRVLVLAVHQRIYGARKSGRIGMFRFVLHGFPALVRREWRVVTVAALLLWVPLAVMLLALQVYPDGVYLLLSPHDVSNFEEMYSPTAKHLGAAQHISGEWKMWGFYIANNVRIDFQCFAGGIAFGLGAIFFLVYNGLHIGAVAGHLTQVGYVETFWSFVAGHSAFELTGAVLSGAAGLKLGQALIAPGLRTRRAALREDGVVAVKLLFGAAALTFLAAFLEAFWSGDRTFAVQLKYAVGAALWTLTLAYLGLAGRERHAA